MSNFHFTFQNIERQYKKALDLGYEIITCEAYYHKKKTNTLTDRTIVNRVDIDASVKKAYRLVEMFNKLGVKSSFFLRLHAPEYNPFSFENYRIVKYLVETGHELGYHSEVVDESVIWGEDPIDCLVRDIEVINRIFNTKVKGIASHGGATGLNNLDFWTNRKAKEFGLLYEAYDKEPEYNLFQESFYISDSEWTRWKCYDKGVKIDGDSRSFEEHLDSKHRLLHLLIHSDTYFDHHFYE